MMLNPRIGQLVRIRYRKVLRDYMPLHDKVGRVEIVSRGSGPRNHGVRIDGKLYGVPCGNLFKVDQQ